MEDRLIAVKSIEEARDAGSRIKPACEAIGIDKRTYERWRINLDGDRRQGPLTVPGNKLSDLEVKEVIQICNSDKYKDKTPSQIVPLLADEGRYIASESSFYRILKAAALDVHRHKSKPASRKKPDELVATGPNQVYSWDITYLKSPIAGMFFYLYFVMDIYSRKIVGWEVHEEQSADLAASLMAGICKAENIDRNALTLHSDNGGPMKGGTMLATLQRLGVMPSFSRPSVSNDNPYSESLFKTTKYCPQFPSKPFESIVMARDWVETFVYWYNEEHLHSGISYVTPSSRHRGEDVEILAKRHTVYQTAKNRRPDRWSQSTRNWTHIGIVFLNCLKGKLESCNKKAA